MSTDPTSSGDPAAIAPVVEGDPAPPVADPPPADPPADPPAPDPAAEEATGKSFTEALSLRGVDMSKYQDEDAAADGVAETIRTIGSRTKQDRERDGTLSAILEHFGEEGVAALTEGKPPAVQPEPATQQAADYVSDDQIAVWRSQNAEGKLSDTDAAKWRTHTLKQERIVNAMVNDELPDSLKTLVSTVIDDRLKDFSANTSQEAKAQQAANQEEKKRATFYEKHGDELFLDPKRGADGGLTPLGQKVATAYSDTPELQSTPLGADRLALAYMQVAEPQTPVKPPTKTSRAAKHDPATTGTPKNVPKADWFKTFPGGSDADYFRYYAEDPT